MVLQAQNTVKKLHYTMECLLNQFYNKYSKDTMCMSYLHLLRVSHLYFFTYHPETDQEISEKTGLYMPLQVEVDYMDCHLVFRNWYLNTPNF
jgi:hypothetical protein